MKKSIDNWMTFLVGLIFFIGSPAGELAAQPTLMARWTFNNSGEDISGNGFDASLLGTADYIDDAIEGSHSLLLTGSPGYARSGAIDFGDQFTICAWCFLEDEAENIQTVIGNAEGGSMIDGFKLFINNWETSNKRIIVETSDGETRLDGVSPEGVFEAGFWNHVAASIDRSNGVTEIYYNGDVVTESSAIVPGFQVTQSVFIGAMLGPSWHWNGMLDDVRIFEGLLTGDEINDVIDDPESGVDRNMVRNAVVDDFELSNYPNPFNPETNITFSLQRSDRVLLEILNIRGEHIRTLVDDYRFSGRYSVFWNGTDETGIAVSSGVYFYRVTSEHLSRTAKMLLVR